MWTTTESGSEGSNASLVISETSLRFSSNRCAPVWARIVETAEQRGASVIVIGAHGRTGIGVAVMGSVANAVAQRADVPVLVTRLPRD